MSISGVCSRVEMDRSTQTFRWRFWVGVAAVSILALWLLNNILLPFIVGAVVAYLFDPLVSRLQRHGLSRTWGTVVATALAFVIGVGLLTAVLPPLFGQLQELVVKAPDYAVRAAMRLQPMIEPLRERLGLPPISLSDMQAAATRWAGSAFSTAGAVLGKMAVGGIAVINLLALLFLTPVVTFYLLRDWEKVMAAIDNILPLDHAETIRKLAGDSNVAIAGYMRGQALVCLLLGTFYAVGLTLVGLQFGFVIGLTAGLISFIPYVGTFVGGILAIGMALAQFPPEWIGVAKVAGIFVVGQMVEGNILAPKLVGDRVGLHPVWIMFALLAGGSLFGFVGVLVAVPISAVLGVIVRHLIDRYRASTLYLGDGSA